MAQRAPGFLCDEWLAALFAKSDDLERAKGSLISRCSAPLCKRPCRGQSGSDGEAALRSRADVQAPDPLGDAFSFG